MKIMRIIVLFATLGLGACAHAPLAQKPQTPVPFDNAVKLLANDLFQQVRNQSYRCNWFKSDFVFSPLINEDSGEETQISQRVEDGLRAEAQRQKRNFVINDMLPQYIADADYVVTGIIRLEKYQNDAGKIPHLILSIADVNSGLVVAHAEAWIADNNLGFEPTPFYQDSPLFMKDSGVQAQIAAARAEVGSQAAVVDSLERDAKLNQAAKAYEQADYAQALKLFEAVAGPQVYEQLTGRYQALYKLGRYSEAEVAFADIIHFTLVSEHINVKFLFKVHETAFYADAGKLSEYALWLRQIAKQTFPLSNCLQVVGHASHSGSEEYNDQLSLKRAERISELLNQTMPGIDMKTQALGRGFHENVIGIGTDDARDAMDRRVEFKLLACGG